MAATNYSLTNQTVSGFTATKANDKLPAKTDIQNGWRVKRVDLSKVLAAMKAASGSSKAFEQNDAFAIIPLAKGDIVEHVVTKVLVADANAAVFSVGDTGSTAGYITTGVTCNAAADTLVSLDGNSTLLGVATTPVSIGKVGKVYTADDAIVIKLTSATLPATTSTASGCIFEVAVKVNQVPFSRS